MRQWRKLYSGIRSSDKLYEVPYDARWLYILLLSAQDDAGRYEWTPAMIRALVAPSTMWTPEIVEQHMGVLVENGLLVRGQGYVEVVGGAEKNGVPGNARGKAMLYEIPDCDSHAVRSESHAKPTRPREKSREEKSREEPPVVPRRGTGYSPDFEDFWEAWPTHKRKTDKKGTYLSWTRRTAEDESIDMIAVLEAYKKSDDWTKNGGNFIPAPKVWLNQRRYEVDIETLKAGSDGSKQSGRGTEGSRSLRVAGTQDGPIDFGVPSGPPEGWSLDDERSRSVS